MPLQASDGYRTRLWHFPKPILMIKANCYLEKGNVGTAQAQQVRLREGGTYVLLSTGMSPILVVKYGD